MKRIYEAPSMLVQKINPVHIFASSVLTTDGDNATVEITENPAEEPDWFYTKESHSSTNWEDSRWQFLATFTTTDYTDLTDYLVYQELEKVQLDGPKGKVNKREKGFWDLGGIIKNAMTVCRANINSFDSSKFHHRQ